LLELPLGLVAGDGGRRQRLVLAGGAVFAASLVATALAGSFGLLLLTFVVFFPASGAFVSLSQAALMDAGPDRRQQRMAAWNLAGSVGAVAGPLLLAAVLAAGGSWRSGYLLLAVAALAALAAAAAAGPARMVPAGAPAAAGPDGTAHAERAVTRAVVTRAAADLRQSVREAAAALRDRETGRWLALLQVSDLLLDVLTGFLGIYLVDVAHASLAQAAIGVAVRLGAGLAGDAVFASVAGRVSGRVALRVTAVVAAILYPAFLIVPGLGAKLGILAALSIATACWYPVAQAGLYDSLPGNSGIAVFLSSAAGLAGAVGPLAVGFLAQRFGLTTALACLAATPVAMAALTPRRGRR
jgi:FSR family fosmidomycin resistance protein-like MFS transporter